jgi:hypothetical protein
MAGRVPWGRYDGDDIEAVMAIMLLREHPHGQRIMPARGDGGIDVLISHSDGQWEIYQVKGFTLRLDASQKRQIKKSWDRLLKTVSERNIRIKAWHVVRPRDPTLPDRDWLDELTTGKDFLCDWVGLATVDGWAAKYQEVIDYYLYGNKDRLLDRVKTFLAAASLDRAIESGRVVEPAKAIDGLIDLHRALNDNDPHYRYEMHVEQAPQVLEFTQSSIVPGLVFSSTLVRDGVAARIDVIARYNEASVDRPVPINMILKPATEAEHSAIKDFLMYGTAFHQIPAEMLPSELPGGFASFESKQATVSLVPSISGSTIIDLVTIDKNGLEIAATKMRMNPPTRGLSDNNAWSWEGVDLTGVLDFGLRFAPALKEINIWTQCNDISGVRPAECLKVLEVLSSMQAGVTIELRFQDGPAIIQIEDIGPGLADSDKIRNRRDLCICLSELQRHIPAVVRIPNGTTITVRQVHEWQEAVDILRGGSIWKTWESLGIAQIRNQITLPIQIRVTKPLSIKIADQQWIAGFVDCEVIAGRWEAASDDRLSGYFYPTDDSRLKLTLATDPQAAQQRAEAGTLEAASIATPLLDNPGAETSELPTDEADDS